MSSPNLNYLMTGGAIVLYMDIYFFIIPTINQQVVTALCNLTPWLTALGYSLCYGTILAKMVRVYYIFGKPTTQNKKVEHLQKFKSVLSFQSKQKKLTLIYLRFSLLPIVCVVITVYHNYTPPNCVHHARPEHVVKELYI